MSFEVDRCHHLGIHLLLSYLRHISDPISPIIKSCFKFLKHIWLISCSMCVHATEWKSMTVGWLLLVVATIVAAASGGIVAETLPNPEHVLWTLNISYILWGTGVLLAMTILVMYFDVSLFIDYRHGRSLSLSSFHSDLWVKAALR